MAERVHQGGGVDYSRFFTRACGFEPFPYQARLGSTPLPEVLEVPTGFGKTEAVLVPWLHAHVVGAEVATRLVYVLPMRVLVEQTTDRIAGIVRRAGLGDAVSVHATLGGALDDTWVRAPGQPTVIVGTQDLLVSRMLLRGYAASPGVWPMQFALLHNDATWVLDEVQLFGAALPTTRQLQAFREKLGAYGVASAVWMSATVDHGRLRTVDRAAPSRIVRATAADHEHPVLGRRWRASKTLDLRREPLTAASVASTHTAARGLHGDAAATLVVVNTVKAAQELAKAVARVVPDQPVALLHSRFRPPDRAAATRRFLDVAGSGGVLVSTQVVEAGVDLDAAALVTELCPWPSLVQRLGRLNRRGLRAASIAAVYAPADDAEVGKLDGKPYPADELRDTLIAAEPCSDLSPASLALVRPPAPDEMVRAVLRRRDLEQLWDTSPSLEGHHTSVTRFVRDVEDAGVWVGWRRGDPGDDESPLTRDELCSAPVADVRGLVKRGRRVEILDRATAAWRPVEAEDVRPGRTLRLRAEDGRYSPEHGWDPASNAAIPIDATPTAPADEAAAGDVDMLADRPVTLSQHGSDTRDEARRLLAGRAGAHVNGSVADALEHAAAWHDIGKAHAQFQDAVRRLAPTLVGDATLYAKSGGKGRLRYERRHFRHELASAMRVAAAMADGRLTCDEVDLAVYLIGAHHGKVRTAIPLWLDEEPRDRLTVAGLCEGDPLPEADAGDGVVLPAWELTGLAAWTGHAGGHWVELAERLVERFGPFRLAYLETLVRAADWAASATPGGRTP